MSDTEKPLLRTLEKELQKLRNMNTRPHGWQASLLAFTAGCLFVTTSSALLRQSHRSHAAAVGSLGGLYTGLEGSLLVAPRTASSNRRVLDDASCPCSTGSPAGLTAQPHVKRRILIFYHIFVSNQWDISRGGSTREARLQRPVPRGNGRHLWYRGLLTGATCLSQRQPSCAGVYSGSCLAHPGTVRVDEMLMPVLQDDLQQAANLLAAYGTKFDIGAAQINSPLNERLTMNLIRQKTLPGDRVLCVPRREPSAAVSVDLHTVRLPVLRALGSTFGAVQVHAHQGRQLQGAVLGAQHFLLALGHGVLSHSAVAGVCRPARAV